LISSPDGVWHAAVKSLHHALDMNRLACLTSILLPALSFASPQIGYAQATGYYKQDSRPTLYQPLNMLDGREITSWCSASADVFAETLTFGFKGVATIDEIRIYTGNGFDDRTFQEFGRAKKLVIRSISGAQTLTVSDRRGLQAVLLRPPMSGLEFTMDIADQYPAEDPEMPVCITDVVFYSEGKALNGAWLTQKLKYDRNQSPILGTWFAGPEGAADRFLSFFFDGTYRFAYQPYDPEAKAHSFAGSYEASSSRLNLEIPGKGRSTVKLRRETKEKPPGNVRRTLLLEGDLPDELKQAYRDRL
jgi:hypothetical protein